MTVTRTALAALALVACQRSAEAPRAMPDARYAAGRAFALTYCAPCHTSAGTHAKRAKALAAFTMDSFADWQAAFGVVRGVLDRWHPDGKVMPPDDAPKQPSDSERRTILQWVERGSPNTPDGLCPDGRPSCKPGF